MHWERVFAHMQLHVQNTSFTKATNSNCSLDSVWKQLGSENNLGLICYSTKTQSKVKSNKSVCSLFRGNKKFKNSGRVTKITVVTPSYQILLSRLIGAHFLRLIHSWHSDSTRCHAATFFEVTELTMVANSGPCNKNTKKCQN